MKKYFILPAIIFIFSFSSRAQLVVHADNTATTLASTIAGSGVAISNPTLNCSGMANGVFTNISSTLGLSGGIVLTTGSAVDTTFEDTTYAAVNTGVTGGGYYYSYYTVDTEGYVTDTTETEVTCNGVANPADSFASCANNFPGDADLTTIAGNTTYDACVLEFDFTTTGDSISFNYVFGSEEYTSYTCSEYNDVFGFFISGGAYSIKTNIAPVPGTSIPVCINSVNCGATGIYETSTCNALGAGSPFCSYYVNNSTSATVVYDGLTTVLRAVAPVCPCDTYHLKIAIADASDDILDSGVFLEGGSLSSTSAVASVVGIRQEVELYPNPANNKWRLTFTKEKPASYTVKVSDITGRTIQTLSNTDVIDASSLASGIYNIEVDAGSNHYMLRGTVSKN